MAVDEAEKAVRILRNDKGENFGCECTTHGIWALMRFW